MPVDERTFNADVVGWINEVLNRRHDLPFSRASFEEHGASGRRDFTLYDRVQRTRKVLTGELKVPDKPYGRSPYDLALVRDAHEKADELGVNYFFTWNVNQLVLWRTFASGVPLINRDLEPFDVVDIRLSDELLQQSVQRRIQEFLVSFLERFTEILHGVEPIRSRPPDEKFIRMVEASLNGPILETQEALESRYFGEKTYAGQVDAWMRDGQGWALSTDPTTQRENLRRAAQLSSYIFLNKLVFYEALRRKFPMLLPIDKQRLGVTATELSAESRRLFQRAMEVSHDYETIFQEDFGSTLTFISDGAAAGWRELIAQIEEFDFTRMDYDIIGRVFERLIDPEERHRYGQHYTMPDIVDVVNAFCIHDPDALVMDSSCGGGTFLVRAYMRKRILGRRLGRVPSHQDLLTQLVGVDSSAFATHLSAINLATRDLVDEANYPRIAHKDFFDVRRGTTLISLPVVSQGLGTGQRQDISVDQLDAVIGNPPYIRQEELGKPYKVKLRTLVGDEYRTAVHPPRFSGRSDIHVYFWPHAAHFLRERGYLGLLTSSTWMDVAYGFRLQEFLLRNFRIVAILESEAEPWFTEARVITAVTILQKEPDSMVRAANRVRFVMLRKPLHAILGPATDEPGRQASAEALVQRILQTDANENIPDWRIRVVAQSALWSDGTRVQVEPADLQTATSDEFHVDDEDEEDSEHEDQVEEPEEVFTEGDYTGSKWGIHLRAPDIYFTLADRAGAALVPLGTVATIKFGVKSGKDSFFFVRDITEVERKRTKTEAAFRSKWAISYADTEHIRIVQAGDKSAHLVEARFLEPEFHRLTEAKRVVIRAADVARHTVAISRELSRLRGTYLADYIRYGQRQGWHEGSTTSSRPLWYDLGLLPHERRAQMFWSMSHQYRHIVPWNQDGIICNHNLFDVWAHAGVDPMCLWAILNSTVVALHKIQFGRPVGREGNLKTEVVDVKMMLVPDPRLATPEIAAKLTTAIHQIAQRNIRPIIEDFALPDRQALDDAVLELLGIVSPVDRQALREQLYAQLRTVYETIRSLEVQAMRNRTRAAQRGRVTPANLAAELWEEMDKSRLRVFPDGFLDGYEEMDELDLPPGRVEVGRQMFSLGGGLAAGTIAVDGIPLDVGSLARAEFINALAECGISGLIQVPRSDDVCTAAVQEFRSYRDNQRRHFSELAATRTSNVQAQVAIVRVLERESLYWRG